MGCVSKYTKVNLSMGHPQSYHKILDISPKATDEDVKRAYLKLAKRFHPDHNPKNQLLAQHRFLLVQEAYTSLKTREQRIAYNRKLKMNEEKVAANNDKNFISQIKTMFKAPKKDIK